MSRIFKSYMMGGFECSTHITKRGGRHDLIGATRHDRFAKADYERLFEFGMRTARDGARWHLIEREPYKYDFSSLAEQARAAQATGIQIIWDLFHYGYPEDLDVFSREFVERFAAYSVETVKFLKSELKQTLYICPTNEISFYAWIAGEVGAFYPYGVRRGDEIKEQLVRATIAAIDVIRAVEPATRFVQTDPAIHVTTGKTDATSRQAAENYRQAQFQAFDMLCGKQKPELGGNPKYLDIIGLNYYSYNQWFHRSGRKLSRRHKLYRPTHLIFKEYSERYERPIFIAETGIEDEARPKWFGYIYEECELARAAGLQLEGLCLYPIVNHPGWDDNRHCHNGLWDYPNESGGREIYAPLAAEVKRLTADKAFTQKSV